MAKKQTENQGNIIENPDVIVGKAEKFLSDNKRKNATLIVGVVLILAIVGLFVYRGYLESRNKEAQAEMFPAIYAFEADSLNLALNGDGVNYGFLKIISDYPGTDAANLANFYAGAIYMNLGNFSSAARHLEDFSSSDYVLQGRAYALTGDAYMEQDKYDKAVSFYKKAVDYNPNKSYTPTYLQKLAIAQENAGDYKDAAASYDMIVSEYPTHRLVQESKKHSARLKAMAN